MHPVPYYRPQSMSGRSPKSVALRLAHGRVIGIVAISIGFMASGASAEEAMRLESAYSFAETLVRLKSALESKDFRIFATIDHRAAAQSVGLDMPPTTVLVYGN